MGSRMTAGLVNGAILMALWKRKPANGLIFQVIEAANTPLTATGNF